LKNELSSPKNKRPSPTPEKKLSALFATRRALMVLLRSSVPLSQLVFGIGKAKISSLLTVFFEEHVDGTPEEFAFCPSSCSAMKEDFCYRAWRRPPYGVAVAALLVVSRLVFS
jgi:hypothetical protein